MMEWPSLPSFSDYCVYVEAHETPEEIVDYIIKLPGFRAGGPPSPEEINDYIRLAARHLRITQRFDHRTERQVRKILQADYGTPV